MEKANNKNKLLILLSFLGVVTVLIISGIFVFPSSSVGKEVSASIAGGYSLNTTCTPVCSNKRLSGSDYLVFPGLLQNNCHTETMTITGALPGEIVTLGMPNNIANATSTLLWNGWVSATNTVSVRLCDVGQKKTGDYLTGTVRADVWK